MSLKCRSVVLEVAKVSFIVVLAMVVDSPRPVKK
jgi:hypothetical protein